MEFFRAGETVRGLISLNGVYRVRTGTIDSIEREHLGDTAYSRFMAYTFFPGIGGLMVPTERLARPSMMKQDDDDMIRLFGQTVYAEPIEFMDRVVTYRGRSLRARFRVHAAPNKEVLKVAEIDWHGQIVDRDARSLL